MNDMKPEDFECKVSLDEHYKYVRSHVEDMPEISGFRWSGA